MVVHPKPDISALYPEAICQGDTACIEILVNEIDSACVDDFDCVVSDTTSTRRRPAFGFCIIWKSKAEVNVVLVDVVIV